MGAPNPGFKVEQNGAPTFGEGARIKVEPPSNAASPADHSDEDIYEDAGDLDFSHAVQGLYLSRIPKYLWDSWSKLGDDEEIEIGTIRVEGNLDDVRRVFGTQVPKYPYTKLIAHLPDESPSQPKR